ncbi:MULTISPECIES: STAS domain-containing protein [Kitasatospora]|uniref:Putative antagonist protein n=1 Tax=Kitasatospora setae (strain ATCC 33774 / DSM 43861 / JCM 3304 / KCC A-0304 / NBRC 14216 / KM-6054) TaxID=452652 RepID=E4N572_KITSK|nr:MULTISPECIES: STAS domain-containing protein [Kitasatospora]BAJ26353.1 putative antagonist protein [Kitasatospora setae KM-6054]
MSAHPVPPPGPAAPHRAVTVRVEGELDHESCEELVRAVAAHLAAQPPYQVVRVDCAAMSLCDSMGLSALLQIRRDTDAAGRRLLLEHRPAHLDRLLRLTGTAAYLLADRAP